MTQIVNPNTLSDAQLEQMIVDADRTLELRRRKQVDEDTHHYRILGSKRAQVSKLTCVNRKVIRVPLPLSAPQKGHVWIGRYELANGTVIVKEDGNTTYSLAFVGDLEWSCLFRLKRLGYEAERTAIEDFVLGVDVTEVRDAIDYRAISVRASIEHFRKTGNTSFAAYIKDLDREASWCERVLRWIDFKYAAV